MNASANSFIGDAQKRQPPTFVFSWMPLWERNATKPTWVSVVGGDVEVGALAAFANGDSFAAVDPYGAESIVSLGEKPLCLRGSIVVQGRKRPLRHLVSCSQELACLL